jgi:hypothetical protein
MNENSGGQEPLPSGWGKEWQDMTMIERPSALLTDLYQIKMMQAYLDR